MKKTIIAVGLLAAFGAAHAETSVTLYGNLNLAVTKKGDAKIALKSQEYRYASHIGVSGKEDLGNGYSAIFKLEAELQPDTGTGAYGSDGKTLGFNRHSYVGLVTPFGAFRFGRSTTPFTNMWVGGNFAEGRGIGEFTGGLAGSGLRTTYPEVAARWNNGFFYDVKKGGFTGGLAITTKGSESIVPTSSTTTSVNNEGAKGSKPAYGAYARYEGKSGMWGYKVGASYQVENGSSYNTTASGKNAPAEAQKAWLVGAGLSYGPASLSAGYAQATINNSDITNSIVMVGGRPIPAAALRNGKGKTLFVSLGYDITPRDHIYVSYGRYKRTNNYSFLRAPYTPGELTGVGEIAGSQYSMGYEHKLSKRTVIYANARKVSNITNSCSTKLGSTALPATHALGAYCANSVATVNSVLSTEKGYSYDLGISHSF